MSIRYGEAVARECNDCGDGGLCTFCGKLHTVTVVKACDQCRGPAMVGGDYCDGFPLCLTPAEREAVESAARTAAAKATRAIIEDRR